MLSNKKVITNNTKEKITKMIKKYCDSDNFEKTHLDTDKKSRMIPIAPKPLFWSKLNTNAKFQTHQRICTIVKTPPPEPHLYKQYLVPNYLRCHP